MRGFALGTSKVGFTGVGETVITDKAELAYAAIRTSHMDDIPSIAENTGLSLAEARTLKKHLFFGRHSLPLPGGVGFERVRFSADDEVAFAWNTALEGPLTPKGKFYFEQLAAHELGERALMARGVPYRNPASWDSRMGAFKSVPPGAHDLAPRQPDYGSFPGFVPDW